MPAIAFDWSRSRDGDADRTATKPNRRLAADRHGAGRQLCTELGRHPLLPAAVWVTALLVKFRLLSGGSE